MWFVVNVGIHLVKIGFVDSKLSSLNAQCSKTRPISVIHLWGKLYSAFFSVFKKMAMLLDVVGYKIHVRK